MVPSSIAAGIRVSVTVNRKLSFFQRTMSKQNIFHHLPLIQIGMHRLVHVGIGAGERDHQFREQADPCVRDVPCQASSSSPYRIIVRIPCMASTKSLNLG